MIIAEYSFDEASGDDVIDTQGNNFSIAATNVIRTTGKSVGGLTSNGSTAATLPDIGRTSNRTIMCWLNNFNTAAEGWIVLFNTPSLDSGAWGILNLSGLINIQCRNNSALARAQFAKPADNDWHHIAGTFSNNLISLYIDGIVVDTEALTGPIRTDTDPPKLFGGTTTAVIDDLRFFDTALTQSEIEDFMNTPVQTNNSKSNLFFF